MPTATNSEADEAYEKFAAVVAQLNVGVDRASFIAGYETAIQQRAELLAALKDFSEIAARAKPNCGPELRALIQDAQEKHSAAIAKVANSR